MKGFDPVMEAAFLGQVERVRLALHNGYSTSTRNVSSHEDLIIP